MVDLISRLGEYQGYSNEVYDGYKRTSQYITVRDGTKLATDIYFPTLEGIVAEKPLPLIWSLRRYHRILYDENEEIIIPVEFPLLRRLLKHGYILAIVDVRGGGASYGSRRGEILPEEAEDGYDVNEWFANQSWCDGNIGMYGISYSGITQYLVAGKAPPHLKAIIPEMAMLDSYSFVYPGGVFKEEFITTWGERNIFLDKGRKPVPVDEDQDGSMMKAAVIQHQSNIDLLKLIEKSPYRDSETHGEKWYTDWSPHAYIDGINKSGIAVYHMAGWYDLYPRDQLTWFNNLTVPQRLLMAPWSHNTGWMGVSGWEKMVEPLLGYEPSYEKILEFHFVEMLRWYDYWLKGIDNGIMNEPSLHYYTMGEPKEKAWKTSTHWPLEKEKKVSYYLQSGPSGSINSVNDGNLSPTDPVSQRGHDEYKVDLSTTTGKATRWTNGYGGPINYPDMRENDSKALTYTTEPLNEPLEITGHPVLHLWVNPSRDLDVFAYLEEVDLNGYSHYLTEGVLRVSHRALTKPTYKNMGLPYHRSYKEDILPITDEAVELVFDLHPISNIFDQGHRIRLTITCADKDNYQTRDISGQMMVYRNTKHSSFISLPIIP